MSARTFIQAHTHTQTRQHTHLALVGGVRNAWVTPLTPPPALPGPHSVVLPFAFSQGQRDIATSRHIHAHTHIVGYFYFF